MQAANYEPRFLQNVVMKLSASWSRNAVRSYAWPENLQFESTCCAVRAFSACSGTKT